MTGGFFAKKIADHSMKNESAILFDIFKKESQLCLNEKNVVISIAIYDGFVKWYF